MTTTDDNMSDDVFIGSDEDNLDQSLKKQAPHPSPTGYRDYKPPVHLLKKNYEPETLHKVSFIIEK